MTMLPTRSVRLWTRDLLSQDSGIAAVEFALILPILLVLWIGGVEVTGALSVDRRINNLGSSIGDLAARSESPISASEVDDIFSIAASAMFPYAASDASMRLTAVWVDSNRVPRVSWSRALGAEAAHPVGAETNLLPESLRLPETQVIMSEVFFGYRPAVGYVITGDLKLEDRMFFVPRLVDKLQLCEKPEDPKTCST